MLKWKSQLICGLMTKFHCGFLFFITPLTGDSVPG